MMHTYIISSDFGRRCCTTGDSSLNAMMSNGLDGRCDKSLMTAQLGYEIPRAIRAKSCKLMVLTPLSNQCYAIIVQTSQKRETREKSEEKVTFKL